MKNLVYVLDIGSSKISLLACCINKGKSMLVTGIDKAYDGFMDGEFFSAEQLQQVINELIYEMNTRLNKRVSNIYVGVPSEFVACVCKRASRQFVPAKKILKEDITSMFDGVDDFAKKDEYIVTSVSPLQYVIDGNSVIKLSNKRVSEFVMDCSYVLVKKDFVELIQQILSAYKFNQIEFISTALAQSQFCNKQIDNQLNEIAIVDVGHITTSVAVVKGEGLLMLSSFSLGGGHITADLMQVNNLTYLQADSIKRKVCLTIDTKKDDRYVVYNSNTKPTKALINITNDIVKARIENIANVVNRILSVSQTFKDIPIYLTGDGVCNFRGVINLFEAVCNRKVYILKSKLHNGEDKYQTSKISLANIIADLV